MSDVLEWFVGNRNPSIEQVIMTDTGDPVDLSSRTVYFQARQVGGTALLVNGTATVVPDSVVNGATFFAARYDWTLADVTAPDGFLAAERSGLVWWHVVDNTGGRTQDYNEAQVVVTEHAPISADGAPAYVELEEFKRTANLQGTSYVDQDARIAIAAASRALDDLAGRGRRFWTTTTDEVRYYTADPYSDRLCIDDLWQLTSLTTAPSGGTVFSYTWDEGIDYVLWPYNAALDGRPWEEIRLAYAGRYTYPLYARSVRVAGRFGWPVVPVSVKQATLILASKLVQRARSAPFGVITVGLEGDAVRIARSDPDVMALMDGYTKVEALVG